MSLKLAWLRPLIFPVGRGGEAPPPNWPLELGGRRLSKFNSLIYGYFFGDENNPLKALPFVFSKPIRRKAAGWLGPSLEKFWPTGQVA